MIRLPGDDECQCCGAAPSQWRSAFPQQNIYRCTGCGSLRHVPDTAIDFSKLYSRAYFFGGEYVDYVGHRLVHEANSRKLWASLWPHLPKPTRLFELGSAYGFFIDFALRHGVTEAFGVDISCEAVEFARFNFGDHFGVADEPTRPRFPYNCLVAWDVWEHLEAPFRWFFAAVKGLRPGGILALTTVDSSSLVARVRGRRWRQLHPPTHLHYPTITGLARAVRRMGLDIVLHRHYGSYRALETYLDALSLRVLVRRFTRLRAIPIAMNLGDEQLLIARKPGEDRSLGA